MAHLLKDTHTHTHRERERERDRWGYNLINYRVKRIQQGTNVLITHRLCGSCDCVSKQNTTQSLHHGLLLLGLRIVIRWQPIFLCRQDCSNANLNDRNPRESLTTTLTAWPSKRQKLRSIFSSRPDILKVCHFGLATELRVKEADGCVPVVRDSHVSECRC